MASRVRSPPGEAVVPLPAFAPEESFNVTWAFATDLPAASTTFTSTLPFGCGAALACAGCSAGFAAGFGAGCVAAGCFAAFGEAAWPDFARFPGPACGPRVAGPCAEGPLAAAA